MTRKLLIAVAAIVVVLVLAVVGLGLFLDANQFRPALAARMGDALGRRVEIGNLKISWFSGGIAAEDVVITDDPAFSKEPFVTAKSVSVGVDLVPLIFSRSLRVQSFTLDHPRVALIHATSGAWNFSSLGGSEPGSMGAISMLVQKIRITGGQISVRGLDGGRAARSYDAVDVTVSNLSFTSPFPFSISAKAPGGGTIAVDGDAGPFNLTDVAETPFHGAVSITHLDLASTGFVDSASGIAGFVDFSGTLVSVGKVIGTKGKATATAVRLLPGAAASAVPMAIDYETSFDSRTQAGTLKKADVSIGKSLARVTGDYRVSGATTAVRMALRGTKMPVTELQAALPAIGVTLPSGAALTQGTLDLDLDITGPADRVTIGGPIALSNATLTGFDLAEKMGAIASLVNIPRGGNTVIETLTGMLQVTPQGTQITAFNLIAPALGVLTGDGVITPEGAMKFAMLAKFKEGLITAPAGGLGRVVTYGQTKGVPFWIQGTTKNPVFVPDVGRAAKEAVTEALKDPENLKKAADAIGDLFRRK